MVGFYDDYSIDDGSESISANTHQQVFQRDGEKCWLCEETFSKGLHIAHQIDAAEVDAFASFKVNGTIPSVLTDPSHKDNLFPLCASCHTAYDAGSFPSWILIPDVSTLKTYIQHEKENYEYRHSLVTQATTPTPFSILHLRALPIIDRTKILYHPAIISSTLPLQRFDFSRWPKGWLGEPTTVIHRAARRGLMESNPVQPIRSGLGRGWQRGVPAVFQVLIGELFRLWARPSPVRGQKRAD